MEFKWALTRKRPAGSEDATLWLLRVKVSNKPFDAKILATNVRSGARLSPILSSQNHRRDFDKWKIVQKNKKKVSML